MCDRETSPLSDIDAADPSVIRLSVGRDVTTYVVFSTADEYAGARHPGADDPHRDDITREKVSYTCTKNRCTWANGSSSDAVAAPSWDVNRCPMAAPGVFKTGSAYVMWFDMASAGAPEPCVNGAHLAAPTLDSGYYCLYYATARDLMGTWTIPDRSGVVCSPDGAIDPEPFSHDNRNYLLWKDGNVSGGPPATIQLGRLDAAGTALVPGTTRVLASQSAFAGPTGSFTRYIRDSTMEAPAPLITSAGEFFLLFATGNWQGAGYEEGIIGCGPWSSLTTRSCDKTPFRDAPLLWTGDFPAHTVVGPGSGTAVRTPDDKTWLFYGSWDRCAGYSAAHGGCRSGSRRVHVVELRMTALSG
ncbi:MAG: family 43 glycosylhydrolase [Acidimicrobiales bacterium]